MGEALVELNRSWSNHEPEGVIDLFYGSIFSATGPAVTGNLKLI